MSSSQTNANNIEGIVTDISPSTSCVNNNNNNNNNMNNIDRQSSSPSSLVIATRLHLGYASHPPPTSQLRQTLSSFSKLAYESGACHAIVAVDSEPKLEGYDLVHEVRQICNEFNGNNKNNNNNNNSNDNNGEQIMISIEVLPVTPWGKFIPALNSIVSWSARQGAEYLLLASAEVDMTRRTVNVLKSHLDMQHTLVVGAVLPGHDYHSSLDTAHDTNQVQVELNGRTTPWNTLALWNVSKLALTGFLLVSEGLHPEEDGREGASGVEEVCTIATLQRILSPPMAQAKLVRITNNDDNDADGRSGTVNWGQEFGNDQGRKEWHERKMRSKITRAKRQLDLLGLGGTVIHC